MKIYASDWMGYEGIYKLLQKCTGKDLWIKCLTNFGWGRGEYYIKVLSDRGSCGFDIIYCDADYPRIKQEEFIRAYDIQIKGTPEICTTEELDDITSSED